jgi:hypothetical protein
VVSRLLLLIFPISSVSLGSVGAARSAGFSASFACIALVCAGCHAPPRDPPAAGVSEAGLVASTTPLASSAPVSVARSARPPSASSIDPSPTPTARLGACATDADCHTWSSYCGEAPCACRVLGRADGEPRCLSASKVQCLVDPCQHKLAACQSGACVLTAR